MLKQIREIEWLAGGFVLLIALGLLARSPAGLPKPDLQSTQAPTKSGGPTLIVNTLDDVDLAGTSRGTGVCPQPCSLRSAITAIDREGPAATIVFEPNLSGTIILQSSTITLYSDLSIIGPDPDPQSGRPRLAISGNFGPERAGSQIFELRSAATITLKNLTIGQGITRLVHGAGVIYAPGATTLILDHCFIEDNIAPGIGGGAIYNQQGQLIIRDSVFRRNVAGNDETDRRLSFGNADHDTGYGGAIFNDHGTVTIEHSRFLSNKAYGLGGAIYNLFGTLSITDSIFTENTASYVNLLDALAFYSNSPFQPSAEGGAIFNEYGVVTITRSAFQADVASGAGGAIYNHAGRVDIANSVFGTNTASAGAGIYNLDGTTQIVNSTFLSNHAWGILGGGAVFNSTGTLTVANSVLVGSEKDTRDLPNCGGVIYSDGHNLQFPGQDCGPFFTRTDPKLHLVNSGSRDFDDVLYTISPDSPVIGAGDPVWCASTLVGNVDRYGTARDGNATCDIGAVQHGSQVATPTPAP